MDVMLISVSTGVYSIDLIQPDSRSVQPGQSFSITCQVSGYSMTDNSYATGWIRQREGKAMDWISHQWGGGTLRQNGDLKNKFSYSRDTSARTATITGQNLQTEDTAVYYCVRVSDTVIQNTKRPAQILRNLQDMHGVNLNINNDMKK
uniref:Ig-like domain-containing protein n=1 Tax=Pundamilia nyererei TaxID=303518 RepID=A0A3B4H586_9CICH